MSSGFMSTTLKLRSACSMFHRLMRRSSADKKVCSGVERGRREAGEGLKRQFATGGGRTGGEEGEREA